MLKNTIFCRKEKLFRRTTNIYNIWNAIGKAHSFHIVGKIFRIKKLNLFG